MNWCKKSPNAIFRENITSGNHILNFGLSYLSKFSLRICWYVY